MRRSNWLLRFPWLLAALVAYYLPWISHQAAVFSLNAYDLAEFTSLDPAVRGGSIPLVTPFLLRSVMAGLALLFGIRALKAGSSRIRWGYTALALWLAITLLPPLDFFRGAWGDPNYRQQFGLSIGTLLVLVVFAGARTRGLTSQRLVQLEIAVAVLVVVAAIVGEIQALQVFRALRIAAPVGVGAVALVACLALAVFAGKNAQARIVNGSNPAAKNE